MKTQKQVVGNIGEDLASMFLMKHGFKVIERNYRKKWGEIDIVAEKEGVLHFVEVKAISNPNFRPEDAMRAWKKQRLSRAIRTYLLDHKIPDETDFRIDIAAVFLDFLHKKARIRMLENVNL
ncbi:MAG: YraN family protein [Candidatus Giovannonibacteria bacterium]|nr:MAG: YraN family protein [Candidatus Giovannonibacteria bacterium]